MTTLAALEHQWAESCRQLGDAHELVRRLTVQHSALGARIRAWLGSMQPRR